MVNEALDIFYALNSHSESDSDHERVKCEQLIIHFPAESALSETGKDSD